MSGHSSSFGYAYLLRVEKRRRRKGERNEVRWGVEAVSEAEEGEGEEGRDGNGEEKKRQNTASIFSHKLSSFSFRFYSIPGDSTDDAAQKHTPSTLFGHPWYRWDVRKVPFVAVIEHFLNLFQQRCRCSVWMLVVGTSTVK